MDVFARPFLIPTWCLSTQRYVARGIPISLKYFVTSLLYSPLPFSFPLLLFHSSRAQRVSPSLYHARSDPMNLHETFLFLFSYHFSSRNSFFFLSLSCFLSTSFSFLFPSPSFSYLSLALSFFFPLSTFLKPGKTHS